MARQYVTKKRKIKALKTTLHYLTENTSKEYGLCNIIPSEVIYNDTDLKQDNSIIRKIMQRRAKKVKTFYNFRGEIIKNTNQFQWKIDDKESRVQWLENNIRFLEE